MERARLHNLRGLERARRYGVRFSLGWLYWNSGVLALALGEWTDSETHLQQAMQEAEATSNARLRPMVMQAQAELQFRKGNWREAEQLFRASVDAAANTEWFPGTLGLYGHFLAVTVKGDGNNPTAIGRPRDTNLSAHTLCTRTARSVSCSSVSPVIASYRNSSCPIHFDVCPTTK